MTALVLGSLLLFGGVIALAVRAASGSPATRASLGSAGLVAIILGVTASVIASAVYVASDQTGVVVRTLGDELPAGHIVAVSGEKGPQADHLLPPERVAGLLGIWITPDLPAEVSDAAGNVRL